MPRPRLRSHCPIHFALETFGDRWSLLVVRDLMFKGRSSYTELLRAEEGIATNILADRLERLQEAGILGRDPAGRYRLTRRGADLMPVLVEMIAWSAAHDPSTAAPPAFVERVRTDREALLAELRAELTLFEEG